MEVQEVLDNVEHIMKLRPEKYKQLTGMTKSHVQAFSITNAVKQQMMPTRALKLINEGHPAGLESVYKHIRTLLLTGIRFLQLTDSTARLEALRSLWEPARKSEIIAGFGTISTGIRFAGLIDFLRNLQSLAYEDSLALDEGTRKMTPQSLAPLADGCTTVAIELASMFGYTQDEFAAWLKQEAEEHASSF